MLDLFFYFTFYLFGEGVRTPNAYGLSLVRRLSAWLHAPAAARAPADVHRNTQGDSDVILFLTMQYQLIFAAIL